MSTARRVLAISPHLDDAALSVGATLADLAARGADIHVVTLFAGVPTEPLSTVARTFHANCGLPEDASAVALRINEDRAAMDELGAHADHCGFLDAVYRRAPDGSWLCGHERAMFDDLSLGRDALLDKLSRDINRILAVAAPDLVLTCSATGDHIDHRLTKAAVLDAVSGTKIAVRRYRPCSGRTSLTRSTVHLPRHHHQPGPPRRRCGSASGTPSPATPPRSACSGLQTPTGLPNSSRTPRPAAMELPPS